MNIDNTRPISPGFAVLAIVTLVSGCSSAGPETSSQAEQSLLEQSQTIATDNNNLQPSALSTPSANTTTPVSELLAANSENTTDPLAPQSGSETASDTQASEQTLVAIEKPPSVGCGAGIKAIQDSTLHLINQARSEPRQCGSETFAAAPSVIWNDKLFAAAFIHSIDMATNNFFSHTGSDGSSAAQRATNQEFNYQAVGENIAAGQPTTAAVIQGWLDSPGHCSNIMNPAFKEIAVTCVEDNRSDFTYYWTNTLGTTF